MKRIIALAFAAIAAMFVLAGCVQDSSHGVRVVGDNVARLPVGETMVLHHGGKGAYTWVITYDGKSKVHFHRDNLFGDDDVDITPGRAGEEVKFDPGWLALDMWVSRRTDDAVDVRWEDGLVFQAA